MKRPQRHAPRPRPVLPGASVLSASALIFEGNGRPALYVGATSKTFHLRLYRVPDGCRVTLEAPTSGPYRGSRVIFEQGDARTVLTVNAVSVARELLEALEGYAQATQTPAGQGAA